MSRKMLDDLGELQRGVMEVVWGLGEASVHQVIEGLGREKRPAYIAECKRFATYA